MSNILPSQPGLVGLPSPFTYNLAANSSSATHYSHTGVGGYVEFPSIGYRNDIPLDAGSVLGIDGMSSGRRKIGMIVYVRDTNKFYQLIPNVNGVPITLSEWNAKSTAEKLVALDPMATIFDDEVTFSNITGTLDPDDAWLEISVPLAQNNITGNGSIKTIISLTQAQYDAITPPRDPNTLYIIV
jgi:hypothetical protein